MNEVIFNLHDFNLLMTAILCVFLSLILLQGKQTSRISIYLLVGFLVAHAFISIHELTYYGEQIRFKVESISLNLFFIGSFAYCFDAVLIYLFCKSVTHKNFRPNLGDAKHFILLFCYFIYMCVVYYSLDTQEKRLTIEHWLLTESSHYIYVEFSIRVVRLLYAMTCLKMLIAHKPLVSSIYFDVKWLKVLVIGCLTIMTADVSLGVVKIIDLFSDIEASSMIFMGLSSYYATFIMIFLLLALCVVNLTKIRQPSSERDDYYLNNTSAFKADYIKRIEHWVSTEKPYLKPDITIEVLANELNMSVKELSVTINRHFQMNFYEYINQYRIEEAKKSLVNEQNKSITEIFYAVGFNSKSVFNTFFKKSVGMTPSQYRKQYLAD